MRALLALLWLLHWLPLPVLGRLGELVGTLLFFLLRARRYITLTNLETCLPHLSGKERHAIAKRHFQLYARSVLERGILWWAPQSRLRKLIVADPAIPPDAFASEPTVLLCPHFVCLDVAGTALTMAGPGCSIYMRQRNPVFDEVLRKGRLRFHSVKLLSRQEGVRPIIRAIKQGLPFFMLPDMDFGPRESEFVPFFGTPAATLTAPARIAAATRARLVPVVATYLPNYQGWKVTFYPAWENYPGDDITAATRRMNAFIEERIMEAPAEYFWTHKRFKTRPPGMPSIYETSKK
jgi:KDO2-lipid IV(A) lauroyltransferase